MTDEQVKELVKAINKHTDALRFLAESIAIDEPLNYSIGRGLAKIAETIEKGV